MKTYRAPWGSLTRVVTWGSSVLLLGSAACVIYYGEGDLLWLAVLLLAIPVACLPFTIRGYAIKDDTLLVERLLWTTELPLAGLESVEHRENLMKGSLRLCGNGGLFSLSGLFWSKAVGRYRALVMDHRLAVLLTFADGRKVMVSPEEPGEFAQYLKSLKTLGQPH